MKGILISFLPLLLSVVNANFCPDGYTQAPQGPCYWAQTFYDTFVGLFMPGNFQTAESYCRDAGAFLTSIHSKEENDYIGTLHDHGCSSNNIGLTCYGINCVWRDGSAVTYTNFKGGVGPAEDGKQRCYGQQRGSLEWQEKDCYKDQDDLFGQSGDCWICKKPIVCSSDETAYNGGCLTVHTVPLNQKSAEESCRASPGGGHLVSIHNSKENADFTHFARNAGAGSTILIGGQFSNGVFAWTDGSSYDDQLEWAKGFPNPALGSCVQILLDSTFANTQQWTNVECSDKQPYICFRKEFDTTIPVPTPIAAPQCPPFQSYADGGTLYSPNFPVSIPKLQSCVYILKSKEGTRASVQFRTYDCQSGTTHLSLFDGIDSDRPFKSFTINSPLPNQTYTSMTNALKIKFTTSGVYDPEGTGWEAEFTTTI